MKSKMKWDGCRFFALRASARKGAPLTGTIIVIAKDGIMNKTCFAGIAQPDGRPDVVPCVTWVSPAYLAKRCFEITEEEARRLQPSMFFAIDAYEPFGGFPYTSVNTHQIANLAAV